MGTGTTVGRPGAHRDSAACHTPNGGFDRGSGDASAAQIVRNRRLTDADMASESFLAHSRLLQEVTEQRRSIAGHDSIAITLDMGKSREIFHAPRTIAKTALIPQCGPMASDDRWEALGWYCRRLIIQELERGVTQTEIADKIGITQPVISGIKTGRSLPHLATAIALAEYFRRTPGELLDEAIKWWDERGGRQESLRVQREEYEKKVERARSEPKKVRLRRQ